MRYCLLLPSFLLALAFARADAVIDACDFPDDASAARTWAPKEGSPAPAMRDVNGQRALTFECKFASTTAGRACWDRAVDLNLAEAEGVQLEIFCRNAGPVSNFMLYCQTGGGWRSMTFSPRRATGWETITLRKSDAREEGKAGGWDRITALRLAAWKGDNEDTRFHIRNLRRVGVPGEDTRIVLVRDSADEKDSFAAKVSGLLGDLGLRHALMAEGDLTPELLGKVDLVILPHNPRLPDSADMALAAFVKRGGGVLACYSLPASLRGAAGIASLKHTMPSSEGQFSSIRAAGEAFPDAPASTAQASWNINAVELAPGGATVLAEWHNAEGGATGFPAVIASERVVYLSHVMLDDDPERKARLLLAMAGRLRPDCWREVIAAHSERMDTIATFDSYEQALASLTKQTEAGSEARARLDDAAHLRAEAEHLLKQARFAKALDATDAATRALREAFCLAQKPKEGELRAMWCHSAYGVKGMTWDQAIARLRKCGFTAIMPNMLWGGVAYYPSQVLPVAAGIAEKGDQVAQCLAACRKHGVRMHVWKVDWNLGHDVPPAFVERMRSEGRLQRSFDGVEQPWLCPSNPANLAMERESLLELARNYEIDGIHFDYIRYPGADHCFCDPCRARFKKAAGTPVAKWPDDARMRGARREEWIAWCQENINKLVRTTSEEARRIRPGIQVSAAVFRNWEVDSRIVMQDWKLWCAKGWLDFVCPMDYTANDATHDAWVRRQKAHAGTAGLVPGIGASSTGVTLTADQIIGQIENTRRHGAKGFIIFNYGEREAGEILPMLGLGATRAR